MARFLVQTIPNKLPELLINLSSQGPHLMGATLSTLLRAVHPGTIAMTDFRQRLRPKVLTRHLQRVQLRSKKAQRVLGGVRRRVFAARRH